MGALSGDPNSACVDHRGSSISGTGRYNVSAQQQTNEDSSDESEDESNKGVDLEPGFRTIDKVASMVPIIPEKTVEDKLETLNRLYTDLVDLKRNPTFPQPPLPEKSVLDEIVKVVRVLQRRTDLINFHQLTNDIGSLKMMAEDHSVDMVKVSNTLGKAIVELGHAMRWFLSTWTDNETVANRTTKCMNLVLDEQRGKVAREMQTLNEAILKKQRKKLKGVVTELEKSHREEIVKQAEELGRVLSEDRVDYQQNHALLVEDNVKLIQSALKEVQDLVIALQAQKSEYESATVSLKAESLKLAEKAESLVHSTPPPPPQVDVSKQVLDIISSQQTIFMQQMQSLMHEEMTVFTQSIWKLFDAKKGEEKADLISLKAKMEALEDYIGEPQSKRMKSRADKAVKAATANLPNITDEIVYIPPLLNVANLKQKQVMQIEEEIEEEDGTSLIQRIRKGKAVSHFPIESAPAIKSYSTAPPTLPKPQVLQVPQVSVPAVNPKRATRSSVMRAPDEKQPTPAEQKALEEKRAATNYKRQQTLKRKREEAAALKKKMHKAPPVPGPVEAIVEGEDVVAWGRIRTEFVILFYLARKFGDAITAEEALHSWMHENHLDLWTRILDSAEQHNIEISAPTAAQFDRKVRKPDGSMNWLLFNKIKQMCIVEGGLETDEQELELKCRLANAFNCSGFERKRILDS